MSGLTRWFNLKVATWMMVFRQPTLAKEYWNRVLAETPDNFDVLAMLAHQEAEDGETASARARYENIVLARPNDKGAWFNYGFLLQKMGDHAAAIKAFEKTTALDEKLDRAWFGKGLSHVALQQLAPAIDAFKKTNKLQPMSPHGFYELAKAQFASDDRDACEKTMRKVKEFDPKVTAQLEDETGIRVGVERWWVQKK